MAVKVKINSIKLFGFPTHMLMKDFYSLDIYIYTICIHTLLSLLDFHKRFTTKRVYRFEEDEEERETEKYK